MSRAKMRTPEAGYKAEEKATVNPFAKKPPRTRCRAHQTVEEQNNEHCTGGCAKQPTETPHACRRQLQREEASRMSQRRGVQEPRGPSAAKRAGAGGTISLRMLGAETAQTQEDQSPQRLTRNAISSSGRVQWLNQDKLGPVRPSEEQHGQNSHQSLRKAKIAKQSGWQSTMMANAPR